MSNTVIVIRSLVPGGVADKDKRVFPGDRLVYVNEVALTNASLDTAVQALKGAPFGPVRLGISRPLQQDTDVSQVTSGAVTAAVTASSNGAGRTKEVRGNSRRAHAVDYHHPSEHYATSLRVAAPNRFIVHNT